MILVVDGMLSGTGLRNAVEGGYVRANELGLSAALQADLAAWLSDYADVHYAGFPPQQVELLDRRGSALRDKVQTELPEAEVGYFSNGRMTRLI